MASNFTHARLEYVPPPQQTKLHTVDVWHRAVKASEGSKWVVFIHGGAWRDPTNDSLDFLPALELLSVSPLKNSIAGFASINYRLSPYPRHPTSPSSPDDNSRNAHHRDHVADVATALQFLQGHFEIDDYLLVGHSAGATIAFQLLSEDEVYRVNIPGGILGIEGIYDIEQLLTSFKHVPFYREFIISAFGNDSNDWKRASPTSLWKPAVWTAARAIIVAHSDADELIDKKQADLMLDCARSLPKTKDNVHFFPAEGNHNEICSEGRELARLIEKALELMLQF